jgi:hypothetical protein
MTTVGSGQTLDITAGQMSGGVIVESDGTPSMFFSAALPAAPWSAAVAMRR